MGFSNRSRVRFGDGDVFQLRIELEGILPAIWRRVLVSGRASLEELHEVIQSVMEHQEELGYHFEVDGVMYRDPDDEPHARRGADAIALEMAGLHAGSRFTHVAEHHGEPWRHAVTVESITPRLIGQRLPNCTAGGRAAPPSDVGSVAEYQALLDAVAQPGDIFSVNRRQWLPEDFDPDFADIVSLNAVLNRMPKRRPAA